MPGFSAALAGGDAADPVVRAGIAIRRGAPEGHVLISIPIQPIDHGLLTRSHGIANRASRTRALRRRRRRGSPAACLPYDIHGVHSTPTLRIGDMNHRGPSIVAGISEQLDLSSAVHFRDPEILRPVRHGRITFEAAPIGRLSADGPEVRRVSQNLNFGRMVHVHFDSAPSGSAAPRDSGAA